MVTPGQGTNTTEVAVFVDYENIRYSTINSYGREPDPVAWRDKALKYGLMAVAKAYADFDQHPAQARTRLDVAGFEAQHYPPAARAPSRAAPTTPALSPSPALANVAAFDAAGRASLRARSMAMS